MEVGRPWGRLAVILGVVALLTALSALAVRVPPAGGRAPGEREPEAAA